MNETDFEHTEENEVRALSNGPTRSTCAGREAGQSGYENDYRAAAFASVAAPGGWYASLSKPDWNPPAWLFGPVWTALYATMAVAAWLVWRQGGWRSNRMALGLFALQLLLNVLWSPLFFTLQRPGWALVDCVLLAAAVAATMVAFWKVSPLAGGLMVPYFAWVCFAAFLNFTIWRMNR